VKSVIKLPSFWFLVILLAMGMAGSAGLFAMMPLFFVTERGFELGWANTVIGLSQISCFFVVLFAGVIIDKVGQQKVLAWSLGFSALLTLALGVVEGSALLIVLFLQPAVLAAFFPAAFASLAQVAHPALRSVVSALGPALAFLLGAGGVPMAIGHLAEVVSLGHGIVGTGVFMLLGVPLVFKLRLGEYSGQAGC
jgi:NNP family nitrate/nitrite transporter-like MFS transporter